MGRGTQDPTMADRALQTLVNENLGLPHSRPMPSIGTHCHELRIRDQNKNWRIVYRVDQDAVLIVEVFNKTTRNTPKSVIEVCQKRLARYDHDQE
jgi:phage-related protein